MRGKIPGKLEVYLTRLKMRKMMGILISEYCSSTTLKKIQNIFCIWDCLSFHIFVSSTSGGVGEGREGVVEHFKPLSRPFSPLSPPWLTPLMGPGCRQERGFASFRSKIDCKCSPNFGLLKGVKAMVIVLANSKAPVAHWVMGATKMKKLYFMIIIFFYEKQSC